MIEDEIYDLAENKKKPSMKIIKDYFLNEKLKERHLVIAIDGRKRDGKTQLSKYLSKALDIPVIHGDKYQRQVGDKWEYDEIPKVISSYENKNSPVIIECIKIMEILSAINCVPDYRVFIKNSSNDYDKGRQVEIYGAYNDKHPVSGYAERLSYFYLGNNTSQKCHEVEVAIEKCKYLK